MVGIYPRRVLRSYGQGGGGGRGYTVESLTVSGDLITPATRELNVDGDGLPVDSGYGIWPAATNLVTNGGFETNTTGWTATGFGGPTALLARTTSDAFFGSACGQMTIDTTGTGGADARFGLTLSNTTTYSVQARVKVINKGGAASASFLSGGWGTSNSDSIDLDNADWQYVTFTGTTGTVSSPYVAVRITNPTGAEEILIDGVQVETGSIATPYIETDGSTESRTAGRVQMPVADLFTATQGAVFARLKLPWTSEPVTDPGVFTWADDVGNRIEMHLDTSSGQQLNVARFASSAGGATAGTGSWSANVGFSVAGAWTSNRIRRSINGGAFGESANTAIPTLSDTAAELGGRTGVASGREINGNILWFATFAGTLTDANAAALNALGDTPPTWAQLVGALPATAQVTGLWQAKTAQFFKAA